MLISRDPCNFRVDSPVQNPLKLIKNEWDIIVFWTEIDFFFIHWFSIFSNFMGIGQWTSYSLNGVISRSLSRSRDFSFTITLRQKLKGVTRMLSLSCNSALHTRNFFGLLHKGYCERKALKSWKYDVYWCICIVINLCPTPWRLWGYWCELPGL